MQKIFFFSKNILFFYIFYKKIYKIVDFRDLLQDCVFCLYIQAKTRIPHFRCKNAWSVLGSVFGVKNTCFGAHKKGRFLNLISFDFCRRAFGLPSPKKSAKTDAVSVTNLQAISIEVRKNVPFSTN